EMSPNGDVILGAGLGMAPTLAKVAKTAAENPSYWGLSVVFAPEDTLALSLRFVEAPEGDPHGRKWGRVSVRRGDSLNYSTDFNTFEALRDRYNSLGFTLESTGRLTVSGGGSTLGPLFELDAGQVTEIAAVDLWSVGSATVSLFAAGCDAGEPAAAVTAHTIDELRERFAAGGDPLEGFWTYFDRQNDPAYARPGGRYTLALLRSADGEGYDLLLVDGAEVCADRWKPMMLKGRLRPTVFAGHYDLEWIDSTFRPVSRDIHATIENGSLLTLSFPLYRTTLRFAKADKY
ncbi:MAG: hypothetical protein K2K72_06285, partial [Duncaniella sp.]|nr:hypothetical protein [Duncaniella sp.]